MVQVQKGAVKFESIKAMDQSAGIPYITLYMRLRAAKSPSKAFHGKVRKYNRKVELNTIN